MPVIKSAKKKMRQDVVRTKRNSAIKSSYKKALKSGDVKKAYSALDKAAKKGIIHKNKANRLKAKIGKLKAKK